MPASKATGDPVCALLDGLPMENHPYLKGRLEVDDPDGWSATYPVTNRCHGTAMASLIAHGDRSTSLPPLARPVYVRPILKFDDGRREERAPRGQLWIDLIHQSVRRMLAPDVPNGPVAPQVKIINLSVGDPGRPFFTEMSPLARLIDWLAWKYQVLFVVSAGNHPDEIPAAGEDDAMLVRHLFEQRRHRRLLSPAETINGITVGALNSDAAEGSLRADERAIPVRPDIPAAYSAMGRGFRRSVKPDILVPGGRRVYKRKLPIANAPWIAASKQRVGHLAAIPQPAGKSQVALLSGTSNAAALTTRAACQIHEALDELLEREEYAILRLVSPALLVKALLVHGCTWHSETLEFLKESLSGLVGGSSTRDELAGVLGYGTLQQGYVVGGHAQRATCLAAGSIAGGERIIYRFPMPEILHLHTKWRRLTGTLAWFSPTNPSNRKYRVAQLAMELPKDAMSPLRVTGGQVHGSAVTRGTVQHVVLEEPSGVIDVGRGVDLEIAITCAEDGGSLTSPIDYALALSLEVAPETRLGIYENVATRLGIRPKVHVQA